MRACLPESALVCACDCCELDWHESRCQVKWYTKAVGDFQKYSVATSATLGLLNGTQSTIIQTASAAALILSAMAVARRDAGFSIGDVVSVNMYMLNLFTPLSFLGTIYGMVVQSMVDMQNLSDLLGEKPDVQDVDGAVALPISADESVAVEFDRVKFAYKAQTSGIHDVSFRVAAGTTTGIIGSTGAGKTTISRLLFRFYDVDSGEIRLNGWNVAQYTQQSVRRLIGIVPQDTCLFNASVLHNVSYGDVEAPFSAVEDACRKAQILDFINALPEKWQTKVGERGLKLSGGEKQRVAIARCLLKKPPVVVLDEATSALDTLTEQLVQEAIQRLSDSKRTFLVIAHRLSTVMNAEQIIVLAKGAILEKGSHSELLRSGGRYSEMWHAQHQADAALKLMSAPALPGAAL